MAPSFKTLTTAGSPTNPLFISNIPKELLFKLVIYCWHARC